MTTSSESPSKYRKPYIRPVKTTWWITNSTYIKYMIRELTVFFGLWVVIELLILLSAYTFYPETADTWTAQFIQNPIIIVANIVSLVAVMFHTITWYEVMPKAVRFFSSSKPDDVRLIPPIAWKALLWMLFTVAFVLIFIALNYA